MKNVFIIGLRSTRKFNLQLFAGLEDIISANAQAFEGSNIKENFEVINTKLSELGYDVLINNKKQSEFIPVSRLNDVIQQRDSFKGQIEQLNDKLKVMEKAAANSPELLKQIQEYQDSNKKLLDDLENMKVQSQIFTLAKDAIDVKDVLAFIDYSKITKNAKGEHMGIDAEVNRVRTEKPYLFGNVNPGKNNAGTDPGNNGDPTNTIKDMNAMIRRVAGRSL